jgi:hypothetical protein
MYVIFPAEEVVELTLRGLASHQHLHHHLLRQRYQRQIQEDSDSIAVQQRHLGQSQDVPCTHPSRPGEISPAESFMVLCGLEVRVPGYRSRDSGIDSQRFQIFREVVCLERGPLSFVSTAEEYC